MKKSIKQAFEAIERERAAGLVRRARRDARRASERKIERAARRLTHPGPLTYCLGSLLLDAQRRRP